MADNNRDHLEGRVGKLEAGLQSLTDNVNKLAESVNRETSAIFTKLDSMQTVGRPDLFRIGSLVVGAMAVTITILGVYGNALIAPLIHDFESERNARLAADNEMKSNEKGLDDKLQREQILLTDTVKESIRNLDDRSKDRYDRGQQDLQHLQSQIDRLTRIDDERRSKDDDELRDYRNGFMHNYKLNVPDGR